MIKRIILLAILILSTNQALFSRDALKDGFISPQDLSKPSTHWYWLNGNISREGITKDLEGMVDFGVREVFIGNVDVEDPYKTDFKRNRVEFFSEEWWDLMVFSVREARRLGIDVGVFNCPGWSQSGGPWIEPHQSTRFIMSSEVRVSGPSHFHGKIPAPGEHFQDVSLLMFPVGQGKELSLAKEEIQVSSHPELIDGDLGTVVAFNGEKARTAPLVIDVKAEHPFTARSLLLHSSMKGIVVDCELKARMDDGSFKSIIKRKVDRNNMWVNVGPWANAPISTTFPAATSNHFQLLFSGLTKDGEIAEVEILSSPRLEDFSEKQLAKMFQSPQPLVDSYLWLDVPEVEASYQHIELSDVINISGKLKPDGTVAVDVPPGEWIILRSGMLPTQITNTRAPIPGRGLEVDKMSKKHIRHHFDAHMGELWRRLSKDERKSFSRVIAESHETGPQNWTDDLEATFEEKYGYDPIPWMLAFSGRVIGDTDMTNRFFWDLRRLIADRISTEYIGGFREICNEHGLKLWLENYGHWGFPGEFLMQGAEADNVSGEFWAEGPLGDIEVRNATSSAHIYGKNVIWAEAFTCAFREWERHPWEMKRRGDWSYAQGINQMTLHLHIHQPWNDRIPGVNAWFGTEFNRHNTWYKPGKVWVDASGPVKIRKMQKLQFKREDAITLER